MNMKTIYITPEIKITEFDNEDVITASGNDEYEHGGTVRDD